MKLPIQLLVVLLATGCSKHHNDDYTRGTENKIALKNGGTLHIVALSHDKLATPLVEAEYQAPAGKKAWEDVGVWSGTDLNPTVHESTNSIAIISPDRQTFFVRTDEQVWGEYVNASGVRVRPEERIWNGYTMLFPDLDFSLGMEHYRSFTRLSEEAITRIHAALYAESTTKPTVTIQHYDPVSSELQVRATAESVIDFYFTLREGGASIELTRIGGG